MIEYYKLALSKYAEFSGRSTRSEYWYFVLANMIISFLLGFVSGLMGNESNLLGMLYSLAVLIPAIAVGVRRLHDIGKSGWMLLVALIPIAGIIWLIVLLATDSQSGSNQYGPATAKTEATPAPATTETPEETTEEK